MQSPALNKTVKQKYQQQKWVDISYHNNINKKCYTQTLNKSKKEKKRKRER
jgi:hypothetical protein